MGKVIVMNGVMLDGVMQGRAAPTRTRGTGSGVLIGSLMAADAIDEYLLMIHPLVLGSGRRLFAGGTQASLRLLDSVTTSTGVVIATYERAGGLEHEAVPAEHLPARRRAAGPRSARADLG